jgi:hypothetical protein
MPFPGTPQHLPCPECGASVPQAAFGGHVCDWEQWLDHQVTARREELERIEADLGAYLASPKGRFELWYAERDRARAQCPAARRPSSSSTAAGSSPRAASST